MSFLIDDGDHLGLRTSFDLVVSKTIIIPALCVGTLPHNNIKVIMNPQPDRVSELWLVRLPIALSELNLLVDQGPIDPTQEITTKVLNLNHRAFKVAAGRVISRLVSVSLE